jgi:outer membrane receptor protein involved in Fe transport
VYFNLGATYKFTGPKDSDVEVFAGIQNLLDRDPPVAPSNQGSTNMILFDPLGRAYRLGVRANF